MTTPTSGPTRQDLALMFVAEVNAINGLINVGGLTSAGLAHVRRQLRLEDTAARIGEYGEVAATIRADLLDRVARQLAGADHDALGYYRSVGDLIESAPDDASSLD